jgi:NTP pyrophosphatase (non-canonical NTP hydrolase)
VIDFNEYQSLALRTMNPKIVGVKRITNCALGAAGEAGEIADLVKKHLFHDHPLETEKLIKEAGDNLWYLAVLTHTLGVPLSDVAQGNVNKLRLRYPDGFDPQRSINRSTA